MNLIIMNAKTCDSITKINYDIKNKWNDTLKDLLTSGYMPSPHEW